MTDQQILNNIDFIHESGLGRGGFSIHLSPHEWQLYEYNLILESFRGNYVNPIGPFHKWVAISAVMLSADKEYYLFFKKEFWKTLSEQDCIEFYIKPFLFLLRKYTTDQIDSGTICRSHEGYTATTRALDADKKEYFPNWLESLRRKNNL